MTKIQGNAAVPVPKAGLAFLDIIPPIGASFTARRKTDRKVG
jgi:hypothetical protein